MKERGLSRALFPLEGLYKVMLREIAERAGLHTASREESMGNLLCRGEAPFSPTSRSVPNAVLARSRRMALRFNVMCVYSGLPSPQSQDPHRCENGAVVGEP